MSSPVTVSLDEATLGALDSLAEKIDRPRESLVAEAIADYVALNAWAMEKIETGVAAADARDFATAEEIARVRAKYARPE